MQASNSSAADSHEVTQLAKLLKVLADPTRLRILRLLVTTEEEICVCEFVDSLQERQYNVSKHIRVLEAFGFIRGKKDGRFTYYRLLPDQAVAGENALRGFLVAALRQDQQCLADIERFSTRLARRVDGRCRIGVQSKQLAGE